jgi:hypothetical protein
MSITSPEVKSVIELAKNPPKHWKLNSDAKEVLLLLVAEIERLKDKNIDLQISLARV